MVLTSYTDNNVRKTIWCDMLSCDLNVLKICVNVTCTLQKKRDTNVIYAYKLSFVYALSLFQQNRTKKK